MINALANLGDLEIIFKCFNNILYYPHVYIAEKAIIVFIPFLHNYFNLNSILK